MGKMARAANIRQPGFRALIEHPPFFPPALQLGVRVFRPTIGRKLVFIILFFDFLSTYSNIYSLEE